MAVLYSCLFNCHPRPGVGPRESFIKAALVPQVFKRVASPVALKHLASGRKVLSPSCLSSLAGDTGSWVITAAQKA